MSIFTVVSLALVMLVLVILYTGDHFEDDNIAVYILILLGWSVLSFIPVVNIFLVAFAVYYLFVKK